MKKKLALPMFFLNLRILYQTEQVCKNNSLYGAQHKLGVFQIVAFAHSAGMNRPVEKATFRWLSASRRVGCANR
jgi:hypothetical protein